MAARASVSEITSRKGKTPIVTLTAYTAPIAQLLDNHVDILLVGDSMGMVLYGMPTTRDVTLDMMIAHGKAVVRASSKALVVVDMPFGSVDSPQQALANCQRVLSETGAQAVKIEGGQAMAETLRFLTQNGVAVMGHVGLLPQQVREPGGYRWQGRTEEEAKVISQDALAIEKAGVFSMVIEAVKEEVARHITSQVKVPTIGIGASPACDGQVLVTEDMLGLSGHRPSFVKPYADLRPSVEDAVASYAQEVRARIFPSAEFCFPLKKKT